MLKKAALIAAAGCACVLRSEYEKKHFSVEEAVVMSDKILSDRIVVFLSDLHNNEFGSDNQRLIEAMHILDPDAILCGGDMMVSRGRGGVGVPLKLMRHLGGRYPVYYGNGNHENRMRRERKTYGTLYEKYRDALRAAGVVYLEDETAPFGPDILISGLDLDAGFYRKALLRKMPPMGKKYLDRKLGETEHSPEGEKFRILLAHSPLYFKDYVDWGADLVLSGHFHGGTIRLPVLGGVMTPQYQFFLPWCAGSFEQDGKRMVVSRGLGTHSINIRLNNRPQIVILRLVSQSPQCTEPDKG